MAATDKPEDALTAQAVLAEQTAARIRELNERLLNCAVAAGSRTVDAYERALGRLASVAEKEGGATPLEWLTALSQIQADFVRDVSTAYTAALRILLD
jgi:hypothetical protein